MSTGPDIAIQSMIAERACERLVMDSAAFNDANDWSALASLYTTEAQLTRPSGQVIVGREAIEESYRSVSPDRRTRHVCSSIRVTLDGRDAATAQTVVQLYVWTHQPDLPSADLPVVATPLIGQFDDALVRVEDTWLIAVRRASLIASTNDRTPA